MNPAPVATLRLATEADVATTLAWSPTDEDLRRWSGPSTRCPATPQSLWEDITSTDATTFAWQSPTQGLVGLGQVRWREQTYGHLARIIVDPERRGRGLGRALCLALMREAVRLHPIQAFSLYVYPDNLKALTLYRSLGFVEQGMHPQFNCLLLHAPLTVLDPLPANCK
jgi:ribosomal protein S18 acetylase RimI-like enzyme